MYIYAYRVSNPSAIAIGNGRKDVYMRERTVEAALVKAVGNKHGMALKFVSPGLDGVPDRIVLLPDGRMAFVELKAPGKTMRPLQRKRMQQLRGLGFMCYCIDRIEQIGGILDEIQSS